ncbi:MAG: voltage-gated potassium channel [Akkermansiaceae bacterium]|jgi:voltage-gated potassium channel
MILIFRKLAKVFKFEGSPLQRFATAIAAAIALSFVFGIAFYFAERDAQEGLGLADSVWWAMVTMTTVGYGDYFPLTWVGRFLIAYPCFLLGISLIGILLGTVSEAVVDHFSRKRKGQLPLTMKNHVIIAGCPSVDRVEKIFGELRISLGDGVSFVIVSNQLEEIPQGLKVLGVSFVKGGLRSEEICAQASAKEAQGIIVLRDTPEPNDTEVYATASFLKNFLPDNATRVLSMVEQAGSVVLFRQAGLRFIWGDSLPDRVMTQDLNQPGIGEVFSQLLSYRTGCEIYLRKHQATGMKVMDLQHRALESPHQIQVIGIKRGSESDLNPAKDKILRDEDLVIVIANNSAECDDFIAQIDA